MSLLLSSFRFPSLAQRLFSTATATTAAASESAALQATAKAKIVHVRVPYFVHRTKLAQQLPVYPKYRYKGTQVSTLVRRIEGDGKSLAKEIQAAHPEWTVFYNRNSNLIEVKGNHVRPLREFLTAKGF